MNAIRTHVSASSRRLALRAAAPVLFLLLVGCSRGVLYRTAPALQFEDLDYGLPTQVALAEPAVSYIDVGSGPETLLLVHGLASNAGFWRYTIPALAEHYRVIAVDLPGYGRSQKDPAYPYSMTFFAETLSRLLDELRLESVVVVGHSMGGQIGLTLALARPDQVRALVLASPAGIERFDPGEGDWLGHALTITGIRAGSEESIRRNLSMNFYSWSPDWEWMVEERARLAKSNRFDFFADAVVKSVSGMLDEPTTDRLALVSVPTLIVYGQYDGLIPNPYLHPGFTSTVMEAGAAAIPGAKLVEVAGAGHLLQIEKPEAFNRAVREFLDGGP